jgi:DNA-binding transcriptional regulator YhcF (GntR family)
MEIIIDRESNTPAYRQIVHQFQAAIQRGKLQAGYKLPTERDLARDCEISRGTVKKAYEELERENLVQVVQGSGTFVAGVAETKEVSRKESAIIRIEGLFDELLDLNFSINEIKNLFYLMAYERERQMEAFHIAAVDCNPEALAIYEKQLLYLSRKHIHKILLSDLEREGNPSAVLREYDLIITTTTHFREIEALVPDLSHKLLQAAVSPSQKTVVEIASIGLKSAIAVISYSSKFGQIISERLSNFQLDEKSVISKVDPNDDELYKILESADAIILPPGYPLTRNQQIAGALTRFRNRGGRLIEFEYRIEQGSLVYVEDRISEILQGA